MTMSLPAGFIQEARDTSQAGVGNGRRNAIQLMLAAVDEDGKQVRQCVICTIDTYACTWLLQPCNMAHSHLYS